ncbi:M56 family metallopeptidase [Algoriphagus pacificus]|uniref:Lipocalin family protein n=1 Tax=Algoriphagus pacificus TaxID=2811234 RepID=A0ABS3CFX3_9BACT|nr:M56 family metallopeptidase [Algoriphagus pacificus]MBN7815998.1 lipocalin family protein [Algoriphagus pacificus]
MMQGVFTYLLESSLALVLVAIFYKLVLEDLTFFDLSRAFLLVLITCAAVLPLISIDFQWLAEDSVRRVNNSLPWLNGIENQNLILTEENNLSWYYVPLLVYLAGLFFRLVKLGFGIYRTLVLIAQSQKIETDSHTLVINPKFIPASFFNFILLPTYQENNSDQQQILLHESVHIQKGHSWDVLFVQLLKSVFWFNPAIYMLEKQLREVHEFQADQAVTSQYSPVAYSRLLLRQLRQDCGLQFMNNFNQFQTKKRIIMMNKSKSNGSLKSRFLLGVPMIVLMIGLFSCDMAFSESELTGVWKGTEFKFEQTAGPDLVAMVEGGRDLHIQSRLALNEDGTVQITSGQGEMNGSGTWVLKENQIVVSMGGEDTYYEILSLTDTELITKHEVEFETPMGKLAGTITLEYER